MVQRLLNRYLYAMYDSFDDYTTTGNDYADAGAWDTMILKTKTFLFATTTNDLTVKVLGSMDGGATYPYTAVSEFSVTTAAAVTKEVTSYYTNLKVQVKPAIADQHGTLSTQYAGTSF
ncbi:MAG: hypothetical protein JRI54_00195 [Deltaproteobacteria bacterium]|nr:hypothetical protein [Deltaproteobacteria bacterium]